MGAGTSVQQDFLTLVRADVLVLSVMLGVLNLRVDHALNGEVARPFAPAPR